MKMTAFWRLSSIPLLLGAITLAACSELNFRDEDKHRGAIDTKGTHHRIAIRATANRALYVSKMLIDGDSYDVVIDTGSSSIHLNEKDGPPRLPRYHGNFKGAYGLNASAESRANDSVYLANVTLGGFTAANQTLAFAATNQSVSVNLLGMTLGEDFPIDGSPETFWQRILGQMDKPVVSAVVGEKDGFFEIGKIPDGEYEGDLTTVPLQKVKGQTGTERFYQWKVATPSYRVSSSANDSKLVTRGSGQYRSAIVDSATSSMLIDREAAKRYHASINVTEKVTMKPSTRVAVKCNAALPDLFLGVTDDHGETRMVRVRGQSLIMPYDEGEVLPAYRSEISKENGWCLLGLEAMPPLVPDSDAGKAGNSTSISFEIWGLPFLRSVFTVFDFSKPSLQFAQRKQLI